MKAMKKPTSEGGITSLKIKFLVYEKWGTITAASRAFQCSRTQLSYCIARRIVSPSLRARLAGGLGLSVEELFGGSLAHFWDTHDLTDFEDQLEEVSEPVFDREAVVRVHLLPEESEALNQIAKSKGIDSSDLIREWVLEKIHIS